MSLCWRWRRGGRRIGGWLSRGVGGGVAGMCGVGGAAWGCGRVAGPGAAAGCGRRHGVVDGAGGVPVLRLCRGRYGRVMEEVSGRALVQPVDECSRPRRVVTMVRVPPSAGEVEALFEGWRWSLPSAGAGFCRRRGIMWRRRCGGCWLRRGCGQCGEEVGAVVGYAGVGAADDVEVLCRVLGCDAAGLLVLDPPPRSSPTVKSIAAAT